jgi:hypothetical protein
MKTKELGKHYVVVFCKGCGAGFRVQDNPVPAGSKVQIAKAQTLKCPGCGHRAEYQPKDIRVARFQKQGLGLGRGKRKAN